MTRRGRTSARGGLCPCSQAPPHPRSILHLSQADRVLPGLLKENPFWSNLHRPSWFLPRAELGLCNCSLDGPACRAVRRSTALPWRWAVPGVSGAGALTQQVCMGMEGGGGGRCFGLGTGLSSRGSVQKNRPGREKLNRLPQGLNVQDATNREGELLLFATHHGTTPRVSPCTAAWLSHTIHARAPGWTSAPETQVQSIHLLAAPSHPPGAALPAWS